MADTGAPVLKGVVQALLANGPVTDLVGQRVYSDVPQAEEFPYILVELASEPFAGNDFSGQTHRVGIHCYSQASSKKEALNIRAAAHAVLDRQEQLISLDAGTLVQAQYVGPSGCIPEDGGKTWDATSQFELTVM